MGKQSVSVKILEDEVVPVVCAYTDHSFTPRSLPSLLGFTQVRVCPSCGTESLTWLHSCQQHTALHHSDLIPTGSRDNLLWVGDVTHSGPPRRRNHGAIVGYHEFLMG